MLMCFLPCLMTIELSTEHTSLDLKSKSCLSNRQLGPAIFFETIVSNSFQHHLNMLFIRFAFEVQWIHLDVSTFVGWRYSRDSTVVWGDANDMM